MPNRRNASFLTATDSGEHLAYHYLSFQHTLPRREADDDCASHCSQFSRLSGSGARRSKAMLLQMADTRLKLAEKAAKSDSDKGAN